MKHKKLHKTLLSLILVILPPYFLVFTDEGSRIVDNMVLSLFGREAIEMDLAQADSNFTEAHIKQVYPQLDWHCGSVQSPFGNQACNAIIGGFNHIPSKRIVTYFAHGKLNAMQIIYRDEYHEQLLGRLIETHGQPRNVEDAVKEGPNAAPVVEWDTGKGLIVLKKTISESDQAALLWFGSAQ